ncbi:CvfB family protein [Brevibacillus ginsengisoli]|uniref:CvfB family protein n=1 Tax=Brevibacillus ginsengisoli TaxID=363854 RepID=UPI003CE84605
MIRKQNEPQAGDVVTLPVSHEKPFGYFLKLGNNEILLHHNEATETLRVGDEVEVFLYHDHENRLAATMKMPSVRKGEYGWLEVVDMNARLGVFLHNEIGKDLLLFLDDLPKLRQEWPRPGDSLLVTLTKDKQGRMLAKLADEEIIFRISQPASSSMLNKKVSGTVYKLIGAGAFLLTEEEHILFIHRDEMLSPLRLGQTVECRVSYVREDGRLNGSMKARKEVSYEEDANRILQILKDRGGSMPYTDSTDPEVLKEKFGVSKSAFKRAMGRLLKLGLVEQEEGWTHLKSRE